MENRSSEEIKNVTDENVSRDTVNKNRSLDDNVEVSQTMEKDNNFDCTNKIDRSVISQSSEEGSHVTKELQEIDMEKQSKDLSKIAKGEANIQNKDSHDNDAINVDKDPDENQYSHTVEVDDIRISVPGNKKGNLTIIEVSNSEKLHDNDEERNETGQSARKVKEVSESACTSKTNRNPDKEREDALAALRKGQTYDEEEDFSSPEEDNGYSVEEYNRAREKYVFFWRNWDIYSQWHKSVFYVHDKKFCNAEQYMMYKKAELFGDREIANQILKCKDPKKIKAFGRQVSGFDQEIWQQQCLHIVKEGNREKFLQNKDFLAELLLSYPKILVEASPYDCIWGIGLSEESPDAWDEKTWQGSNYLGYILTELRDDIMVERGMIDDTDRQKHIETLLAASGYLDEYNKYVKGDGAKHRNDEKMDEDTEGHAFKQETYHLFSGGIYSQFFRCNFTVEGVKFSSAEQYMMYSKAMLFSDDKTAKEILAKTEPKKIKHLGRQVKGFERGKWWKECLQIVKKGNKAKFSQNDSLKKAIVSTYPKVFAEANPHDKLWGIGLKEKDPKAIKKHTWQGKNLLGYALTEARDELLYEWGLLKKEKVSKYIEKLQNELVAESTKTDPQTAFDNYEHTEHPEEADVDDWWENSPGQMTPGNKRKISAEDDVKGKDYRSKQNKQFEIHVRYKNHDDKCDFKKHVSGHQKLDDWNKRGSKHVSPNQGNHQGKIECHKQNYCEGKYQHQKGNYQHYDRNNQHYEGNYHHHEGNHEGKNHHNEGNNYHYHQKEKLSHGSHEETDDGNKSKTEACDRHEKKNNLSVISKASSEEKDLSLEKGKYLETHVEKKSKVKGKIDKSNVDSKIGNKSHKLLKDKEGQEKIVEDFDLSAIIADHYKDDQVQDEKPQSPSKKKGRQKEQSHHADKHSEEIHKPVTDKDEGSAQGNSRRQKKNAKKKKH